jgi:CBS domain containing-hemolysin-like protein
MSWTTLLIAGVVAASLLSLFFSTLTYALRDYSRARLADALNRRRRGDLLERITRLAPDLVFTTAIGRLVATLLILIFVLHLMSGSHWNPWLQYLIATAVSAIISVFAAVAVPHALARHAGEELIATFPRFLFAWRIALLPLTGLMHAIDRAVARATRAGTEDPEAEAEEALQKEILSVVEEGEKEGVVDETEREMIESVIRFRATHAAQIMTARPEIIGLEIGSSLEQIKRTLEESGHSRIPVYEGTLDHIVGILYARDLLKFLGSSAAQFDIRSAMRPPLYVPESKPLPDLLQDFKLQKIHIAIVLDEYGGTAGLITIEDLLEELVGDISDEHEPTEPAMLKRVDDVVSEVDARIYVDELNRVLGLHLPEDAGYDTLGGFVSTTLGHIPERNETFTYDGARFTILDAEPQKVNRVKIELLPAPSTEDEAPARANGKTPTATTITTTTATSTSA